MKVKDVMNSLSLMDALIDSLYTNGQLRDLIGYYDFLAKNSGYHFESDPNDLKTFLEEIKGDISSIRDDIHDKVIDHGQELEV